MKLGTDTGSLVNYMYGNSTGAVKVPAVGDGATVLYWTDRHAYSVVSVSPSGKRAFIQRDKATRTDSNGMSDAQTYSYDRDPDGTRLEVRLTPKGWKVTHGGRVVMGTRDEHYDYSF